MRTVMGGGGENGATAGEVAAPVDTSEAVAAIVDGREEGAPRENGVVRPPLPESESTNVWPDDAAEAAFFADVRSRGEPTGLAAGETARALEETDSRGLPPLDELVKRIPAGVREMLDELFRAKFTGVKRVPVKSLKE